MCGARLHVTLVLLFGLAAPLGCCERKGYVLRGDIAIELNRVSHLIGRHDDYERCPGDCDCAECQAMDAWEGDGRAMLGGEPRLHPVPTRQVFAPQRPTPAPARATADSAAPPTSRRPSGNARGRVAPIGHTSPRAANRPNASR